MSPKDLTDLAAFEAMIDRKVVDAGERMSKAETTRIDFLTACIQRKAHPEDVDDWVCRWHESESLGVDLPEYLGMTREEYGAFVECPTAIYSALRRRALELPSQGVARGLVYARWRWTLGTLASLSVLHGEEHREEARRTVSQSTTTQGDWVYTSEGWRRPTPTEAHRVACGEEPW